MHFGELARRPQSISVVRRRARSSSAIAASTAVPADAAEHAQVRPRGQLAQRVARAADEEAARALAEQRRVGRALGPARAPASLAERRPRAEPRPPGSTRPARPRGRPRRCRGRSRARPRAPRRGPPPARRAPREVDLGQPVGQRARRAASRARSRPATARTGRRSAIASPARAKPSRPARRASGSAPDHADHRRRVDRAGRALVVERDVAADDRRLAARGRRRRGRAPLRSAARRCAASRGCRS